MVAALALANYITRQLQVQLAITAAPAPNLIDNALLLNSSDIEAAAAV
jgi:hypothetical protein